MRSIPLCWLYVPGDRPDRFGKAVDSGADRVVLDLQDAVAPEHKAAARRNVAAFLAVADTRFAEVRITSLGTPWGADDLRALSDSPAPSAIRLPKTESAADVDALAAWAPRGHVSALVETALGVERAFDIARHPQVAAIGLGEADLRSDLGVAEDGLGWARSRIVIAARATGLSSPAMSVYPDVRDLDGLARSCRSGRRLGFVGRAAIHPAQLPVIEAAFRPSDADIADARRVLDAIAEAAEHDRGVLTLPDGRMLDRAMIRAAERTVTLADEGHCRDA